MDACNEYSTEIPKSRKQRVFITTEKIKTIKRLQMSNQSTRFIAETVDISISAVNTILRKIHTCECNGLELETICKKSGPKPRQLDSSENLILMQVVQEDPSLTQVGMKCKLLDLGINNSVSKISRNLKKLSITRKRLKKKSAKTLTHDVINQRKTFARELKLYSNSRLIYLDESGFNLHSRAFYGYSPVNSDAHAIVPANRGRNISLIALLSVDQIKHYKLIDGAYNTVKLREFLEDSWNTQKIKSTDILLMDNVRFHHSSDVKEWCEEKNIIIKYLPPYSPDLNPIENVFSTIKTRYSSLRPFASTANTIKEYVSRVIDGMNNDPAIVYERYYEKMREFLLLAFNGEHF